MAKLLALLLAALMTGLLLWMGGVLARPLLTWLGQLSRHQALIFRSICLFIPILALGWMSLRRHRKPGQAKRQQANDPRDFTVD